jgi:hypothetical protein
VLSVWLVSQEARIYRPSDDRVDIRLSDYLMPEAGRYVLRAQRPHWLREGDDARIANPYL